MRSEKISEVRSRFSPTAKHKFRSEGVSGPGFHGSITLLSVIEEEFGIQVNRKTSSIYLV